MASNISSTARFICRGTGAPQLEFLWFKGDVPLNKTINYAINSKKVISDYLLPKSYFLIVLLSACIQRLVSGFFEMNTENLIGFTGRRAALRINSRSETGDVN